MINNGSLISNTSSGFVQSSGLNYYDGGSSVLPSHTLSPYSQSQKIGGRGGLGRLWGVELASRIQNESVAQLLLLLACEVDGARGDQRQRKLRH